MEIGNRTDAYSSGYYLLAGPHNRQAINEIEQTRAQKERQREQAILPDKTANAENQSSSARTLDITELESYHALYSQDAELDSSTQHALTTYRQIAMTNADQQELMQRIDILV